MPTQITFGTDGWRAVMAREFTFDNVRRVASAIAGYVIDRGLAARGVIVGYDARFLSEQFADEIARVLAAAAVPVWVVNRDSPTPVVVSTIRKRRAGGAVMLTASHNPPEYNGIKFIPEYCHPALPDVTDAILARIPDAPPALGEPKAEIETIDPRPDYLAALHDVIDMPVIRAAGLQVVVDPLYASGRGYLDAALAEAGCRVTVIHGERNPLFGGSLPDPTRENLRELRERVLAESAHLGLATDGDADRFGVIDPSGDYVTANEVICLVFWHLIHARSRRSGTVVRTVATTHLVDAIAAKFGFEVVETPVGFKWVGQQMAERRALLGGEESGGLSIEGHIPEKDGILADLLVAEAVAASRRTPKEILSEIAAAVGAFYSDRVDIHLTAETKTRLMESLAHRPPAEMADQPVVSRTQIDGQQFGLRDGSWFLIRPSGTEPLVRCYMESRTPDGLAALEAAVRAEVAQRTSD
jgi:alpha-D-glucose phosphate-specific phosphoglucomutase